MADARFPRDHLSALNGEERSQWPEIFSFTLAGLAIGLVVMFGGSLLTEHARDNANADYEARQ